MGMALEPRAKVIQQMITQPGASPKRLRNFDPTVICTCSDNRRHYGIDFQRRPNIHRAALLNVLSDAEVLKIVRPGCAVSMLYWQCLLSIRAGIWRRAKYEIVLAGVGSFSNLDGWSVPFTEPPL
jgi:hypothetical protein